MKHGLETTCPYCSQLDQVPKLVEALFIEKSLVLGWLAYGCEACQREFFFVISIPAFSGNVERDDSPFARFRQGILVVPKARRPIRYALMRKPLLAS